MAGNFKVFGEKSRGSLGPTPPRHPEAGRGFGFTYPANLHAWGDFLPAWPLVRIDHIFYNRHFQAVSAETLRESCGSDHLPVMADLMLLKNPESKERKFSEGDFR